MKHLLKEQGTAADALRQRAEAVMPGGVSSPVRAFRAVGGRPLFARRAEGAFLETTDGRRRVDFCMSFGPLILGHAHPFVVKAVTRRAAEGLTFAVTTEEEIQLAELLVEAIPSVEKVRLVSSGTEACMTAVRLARGATGRSKILKFSGCYHGHMDAMLVKAGSGAADLTAATSAGIPDSFVEHTLVAPYNDLAAVRELVALHGDELAAIIVEPVAANNGLLAPADGFLAGLREISRACGALLVFDEVITGFRLQYGSVQAWCGVAPDLVCLGKVIGGGMPVGAVAGPAALMDHLAPLGQVYQAGTLSGHPLAVTAGRTTLLTLRSDDPYAELERRTAAFVAALRERAEKAGIAVQLPTMGSLFAVLFMDAMPTCAEDLDALRPAAYRALFHTLLDRGVYLPPAPQEVCFLSTAHDEATLEGTLPAWQAAFEQAARTS